MTVDLGPIGILTAELMDLISEEYGDRDVRLRAGMVLVDIGVPDDEDGEHWTHVRWKFAAAGDGWDSKVSSSAYAAGLVGEAYTGLTAGEET